VPEIRENVASRQFAARSLEIENDRMLGSQVVVTRALRLLRAISDAFATRDWTALRALYHDEALILSVAAGERILTADELIDVLAATDVKTYSTDDAETEALDENAVIVAGLVRERDEAEVMYAPSAWVLTFKDGLVWRSRAYSSVEKARAGYAEDGIDLGMPGL
jgi:hypothetical protein